MIPVPYRRKKPTLVGWQRLRLTQQDLPLHFGSKLQNIGVLLGEPSRWLVDVDLDHPFTLELAGTYLPSTGAIFGRASKRRSHWLYYSTRPVAIKQWRLPNRQMVVELRSTGGQTVFPGSIHEKGEPIEWDTDGEPAVVDPDELRKQLQAINDEVMRRLGLSRTRVPKSTVANQCRAPNSVISRARKYLVKLPPAISGQGGHNATFHAACVLVIGFGLDREQSFALLCEWNQTCQPPWTDRELEHKVDDALKQPGWRGYLLDRTLRRQVSASNGAIERANRHAIEHRRRMQRRPRLESR
ncbi:MAG: bifunctional DNA primase/polymerase [Planctomycetes bacterium]|nr:bifunctional DNA primase/polymerase [Planctomycetota bacterium]